MGHPRKMRKVYDTPTHPWQGERIKNEHELRKTYGLKSKREVWRAQTRLRNWRGQARALLPQLLREDPQANHEANALLRSLDRRGVLESDAEISDVLGLSIESVLDRRLQTIVYRKGLARTPKGARQLISHGHILVKGRRAQVPSRLLTRNEEESVEYAPNSPFTNELHPMRPSGLATETGQGGEESTEAASEAAPEPPAEDKSREDTSNEGEANESENEEEES